MTTDINKRGFDAQFHIADNMKKLCDQYSELQHCAQTIAQVDAIAGIMSVDPGEARITMLECMAKAAGAIALLAKDLSDDASALHTMLNDDAIPKEKARNLTRGPG